jgi:aminoglycoside 6-adenylyltransferase
MQQLEKIIRWGQNTEDVRGMILSGSLASKSNTDELSDYDIAVFGNNFSFIKNDDWLKKIDEYWVCIHDEFQMLGFNIPTRLTIFNDYLKVDFSFHPMEELDAMIRHKKIPDDYNIGYKILLDKDDLANKLPQPTFSGFVVAKPDEKIFQNNIKEFWFESYHVAKYLFRNDLWIANLRDAAAKKWLLQMLEWNTAAKRNEPFSPKDHGKQINSWLDQNIMRELENCFGKLNQEDGWNALNNTIHLYRKVALETASILQLEYDESLDNRMHTFIEALRSRVNF